MRLFSRFVLPLALIVRLASPLLAAEPKAAEPPKSFDIKAIDDYLASQVKAKGFVGLSVAIMRDGKVVLARGYGKTLAEDRRRGRTPTRCSPPVPSPSSSPVPASSSWPRRVSSPSTTRWPSITRA